MRYRIIIVLLLSFQLLFAQKIIDRQHFINLLRQGSYGMVFSEAMDLRDNVYGKCAILDYFIAKSLCLDGYQEKSQEWLQYILANYPLNNDNRTFIENEKQVCSSPLRPLLVSSEINTMPLPQARVRSVMKSGETYDCTSNEEVINFKNTFSEEELQSRLFEISRQQQAIQKTKSLLNDEYTVFAKDRYILVTLKSASISKDQMDMVVSGLERAYRFYVSYYQLRVPDKLISVYLMPDFQALNKTAQLIHRISLPQRTLGYSLLSDLSLLGIASPDAIGTLYHELFHLLVRSDAGDIPAWLDEGMASLYSVSHWNNDLLIGDERTWRINQLQPYYLRITDQTIPTLQQLLSFNWQQFNGGENTNLCQASVNYSVSNHFLIYLQQMNQLQPLMKMFKERINPGDTKQGKAPDNIALVEKLLNDSIQSIQKKFSRWFSDKYQFDPYESGPEDHAVHNYTEPRYTDLDESARRTLDFLKKKPHRNEIDYAGFEKRYTTIHSEYSKWLNKYKTAVQQWEKEHPTELVENSNMPATMNQAQNQVQQQVQQQTPANNRPQPTGKAKEEIDGYAAKMEEARIEMKQLGLELEDIKNKYFPSRD